MSFWGVTLDACEAYTLKPESPLHVTKAVLGAEELPVDAKRNMVQCRVGDAQPVCICSLRTGDEQTSLDLVFEQGTEVTFLTSGPGTVYLTGYFVQHFVEKDEEEEEEEDDDDEDDEDYVLEDDDDDDDDDEEEADDDEEEEEEEEEDDDDDEMNDNVGKKRKREDDAQPQKRASASPAKKPKEEDVEEIEGRTVHFEDPKKGSETSPLRATKEPRMPVTPQRTPPPAHVLQTPGGKTIPDTIVPSDKKKQASPAKQQASPAKQQQQQQQQQQKQKQQQKEQQKKQAASPQTRKTPEGLTITETRVGTGAVARPGNTVYVRYVGSLTNGKVFDKSGGKPFSFDLGTGQVIRGWDIGVKDMRVGGKRRLVIPPQLGYGRSGAGPIPPNATLIFDVELVSVR